MEDLGPLSTESLLATYRELQKRTADTPVAIFVSPELYHDFTENFGAVNSAYWPGDHGPESPRVMLPVFFGLPVTIDPDLLDGEWYTVDVDNHIIALHVARPGSDPLEWGTIQRKSRRQSDSRRD